MGKSGLWKKKTFHHAKSSLWMYISQIESQSILNTLLIISRQEYFLENQIMKQLMLIGNLTDWWPSSPVPFLLFSNFSIY